ncbi:hypothetical protein L7F22_007326 [Adiantum nelumboides]|nr:hypothetical protein [Adiantum nelumboides]
MCKIAKESKIHPLIESILIKLCSAFPTRKIVPTKDVIEAALLNSRPRQLRLAFMIATELGILGKAYGLTLGVFNHCGTTYYLYPQVSTILQMGRKSGLEWDFVQKLNSIGRGMFVCKCKYCPHVYDGGPNRIRAHILSIKGEGVAACLDPPDAIKEICKKLHVAKGKMSSQRTDVNDHVDANIEHVLDCQDVEKVSSQSPMLSHMDVDINAGPSMKKAKLSSDKNTLAKAWQMQARKAATVAVRIFFYAEDVSHWKVKSPFFLNMVKAIGQAGPSYVPPSYHLLRTKELDEEVRCINGDLLDVKEKWKKYGCTIVSDGWSDIRKRPIINFMACSIYGTIFLKSVDTSGEEKSGEYIFGLLRQVICEVGPANVVQVCMDNA